ncbi:MAG: amino acid permease [Planctomycetota bacterium]|nr:amino acid permease [Planctomycetota bacterium]
MADRTPVSSELSRDLNLFHVTMMGLGMMIGAGVFIGIGISIRQTGPGGTVLAFALNGLIALFTAMSFAELSSAIPRAGGAYNFARIAFGRGPSFLAGWMEWFASSVAGSLYAVVFATYTLEFFSAMGLLGWLPVRLETAERIVALCVAGLFLYVNYRGASETGRVGAFFTLGQTLFVLSIAAVGIATAIADPARVKNFQPFLNPDGGWINLLATMGFIYVAFEGFEVIAQAGDETIRPKSNIPKAMLYSVFIVTLTYVAVSFATVVAVKAGAPGVEGEPWRWIGQFGKKGFGKAVVQLLPGSFMGHLVVMMAVIFSATSALNATIYSAARASYALGRDRMLPAGLSHISRRRRTPWVALLCTGIIVLAVAGLLPTEDVASSASIMFLFLFFLVNVCAIRVRWNMSDELSYGYLMPLFPLPPIIAIICQAVLAVGLVRISYTAWIIAPLWIAGGAAIYLLYSKSRALATADEILVFEERQAPKGDGYRIMVAVANPDNALEMVRNTYKLCGAKDARVELLHMVPVPDQVPLADAHKYMLAGKEAVVETMLYLAPLFPLSTTLRYCRNTARGIVSAVREKKINMLIMGFRGGTRSSLFRLGSTIDPVIERSPADVVILKDCGGNKVFKRILVPVAGGPNAALALEIAGILADENEGQIVAFSAEARGRRFDLDGFLAEYAERTGLPANRIQAKTVQANNAVSAILAESEDYDLVVIGMTRRSRLYRVTHAPVPEVVARRCAKPLVMVKASGGIRSWVKRWI